MQVADPAAQLVAVDLVRRLVAGVRVGTYYPADAEGDMLVITRAGGIMVNPITDGATIIIQAYADTQAGAERLIGRVRQALLDRHWWGTPTRGHICRGWREYAGPQRFTDPDRPKKVRFQITGQLLVSTLTG